MGEAAMSIPDQLPGLDLTGLMQKPMEMASLKEIKQKLDDLLAKLTTHDKAQDVQHLDQHRKTEDMVIPILSSLENRLFEAHNNHASLVGLVEGLLAEREDAQRFRKLVLEQLSNILGSQFVDGYGASKLELQLADFRKEVLATTQCLSKELEAAKIRENLHFEVTGAFLDEMRKELLPAKPSRMARKRRQKPVGRTSRRKKG